LFCSLFPGIRIRRYIPVAAGKYCEPRKEGGKDLLKMQIQEKGKKKARKYSLSHSQATYSCITCRTAIFIIYTLAISFSEEPSTFEGKLI
jgi:hypothetical protein